MDRITVIDYGMGNLRSVAKALEMVGAEVCISSRGEDLEQADRIVLPGVGAYAQCMANLKATDLVETLRNQVMDKGKPFLGICLGMQMLARTSYEDGVHTGLGWLDAEILPLPISSDRFKVPHMGWNDVDFTDDCPLFKGLRKSSNFYFAHSYHLVPTSQETVAALTEYGSDFTSAVLLNNIFATQFHPEKSQENGLQLLENFLEWSP